MTRRSAIITSATALFAAKSSATEREQKRDWISSPLHSFSYCSVYEESRSGAVSYIHNREAEREWYVSPDENELSYAPEIHISPNERFAAMVQKAGSTHIGIHVFSIAPKTFRLKKIFSPYLDAQSSILRFHRINDEFHHCDLSFITWGVLSDCFLVSASGAGFGHSVSHFVLNIRVSDGVATPAAGFDRHNQGSMTKYH